MAWELSASPTCLPNGPASTRCSGFRCNSCPFEPSLCRTAVSVAGKRDFQGGEKSPHRSPEQQISSLRDQVVVQKPRQIGAPRTPSGNLHTCESAWWARELSHIKQSQLLIKGAGK